MGGRISLRGWRSSRTSKKPLEPIPDASAATPSPAHINLDPSLSPSPLSSITATQLAIAPTTSTTTVVQLERTGLIHLNKDTPVPDTYSEGTFPIDIIAVHGLNGGAYSTWTHANSTFWLRDLLTKELPGARIYSFGYEAKVFRSLGTGGFEDFARQLLESIRSERGTPALERRPIIFVCHSMGGIVVKKALNITVFDKKRFSSIAAATVGILFLATPHGGSAAASTGAAVAKLSNVPFMGRMQVSNANLVTSLKLDSKELQNIAREFRHLTKDIDIYSFLEQEIIPGVGIIVDQKSGSMNVDREVVIPMGGYDHRSICRFDGENCVGYKLVLGILKEVAVEVTNKVHAELLEEDSPCLQSLSFLGMQHKVIGHTNHSDSCKWLPVHPTYQKFMSSAPRCPMLLLKGHPGSGKSTLMTSLLSAQGVDTRDIRLGFFFNGNGSMLQRSKLGMSRALLWNLYTQSVDARNIIYAKWRKNEAGLGPNWEWLMDEICELLVEVLCRQRREILIFVDAVDEASDESGQRAGLDILEYLRQLNIRVHDANGRVRICVSCRHYPVFTSGSDTLEIVVEKSNTVDLAVFVRNQLENGVENWNRIPQTKRRGLEDAVTQTAAGVFLWAELRLRKIVKNLNDGAYEIGDLIALIQTESNELFSTYQNILQNEVDVTVRPKALLFMQWVCLAERPLSLEELRLAMACDELAEDGSLTCQETKHFVSSDERMEKLVRSLSGGLAVLVLGDGRRGTVQLFHATIYDFVRDQGLQMLSPPLGYTPNPDMNQVILGISQSRLSQSCFKYLTQQHLLDRASMNCKGAIVEYKFIDYATINWLVHAEKAERCGVNQQGLVQVLSSLPMFFEIWRMFYNAICSWDSKCPGTRLFDSIHLASYWNLQTMIPALLKSGARIDAIDDHGRTALHSACYHGHEQLAELLIKNGAAFNPTGTEFHTPLELAATKGHENIVKMLCRMGADINADTGNSGSALQAAAENGSGALIAMLVRNGAAVNAQGGVYGNALQRAAFAGNLEVVKQLLIFQVEVNQLGGYYGTALHAAVTSPEEKRKEIIYLLLEAGANPNICGCDRGNAFQAAAETEQLDIIQLFLDRGAEIDASEGEYGPPLHAACAKNNKVIAELLLNRGANVNKVGGKYGSALQAAAQCNSIYLVGLLLRNGADVHVYGGKYFSVVQAGASCVGAEVVPLLLKAGARIDMKGGYFGTTLQAAIHAFNFELAKDLLAAGADIDEQGGQYGCALQAAISAPSESFARYLIEKKANVSTQGGQYGSPLQAAVIFGREALARLIIKHGAEIDAIEPIKGSFALQVAAKYGRYDMVEILIQEGANVDNYAGGWKGPALYEAIASDNIAMVQLLLDRGASMEIETRYYKNAFDVVKRRRNASLNMRNFLLSKGAKDESVDVDR